MGNTEIAHDRGEALVIRERHEKTFGWSDESGEGEDSTLFVFGSRPVAMFDERVEDTADSKGRFNYVGDELVDYIISTESGGST